MNWFIFIFYIFMMFPTYMFYYGVLVNSNQWHRAIGQKGDLDEIYGAALAAFFWPVGIVALICFGWTLRQQKKQFALEQAVKERAALMQQAQKELEGL